MNSLFEPTTAAEIIQRLEKLQPSSQPLWGKMNVAQMMAHCQAPFNYYFGDLPMKRGLAGILFGKWAKKQLFTDMPWRRNLPTAREFVVTDQRHFDEEREKLILLIQRFSAEGYTVISKVHPFFGKMSSQEWAMLAYKHLDHHLQQFDA